MLFILVVIGVACVAATFVTAGVAFIVVVSDIIRVRRAHRRCDR